MKVAAMLTVTESAKQKGVSVQTIRAAIARGDLRAKRIGKRLLMVDPRSLAAWTPDLAKRNSRAKK